MVDPAAWAVQAAAWDEMAAWVKARAGGAVVAAKAARVVSRAGASLAVVVAPVVAFVQASEAMGAMGAVRAAYGAAD